MTDRVADLTWRRPKTVLIALAVFVVVAGILGRGVEEHLKAAGFTDSASESERATEILRDELGYDANPGLVVLVRDEDSKRLDITAPAFRKEVKRLVEELEGVDFVGKAVDPLRPLERAEDKIRRASGARSRRPGATTTASWPRVEAQYAALGAARTGNRPVRAAAEERAGQASSRRNSSKAAKDIRAESPLIANDERSVVIAGHLETQDVEERRRRGGRGREGKARSSETPRGRDRRLRAELQRGERPDARGPDQGRTDRVPAPRDHAARRLQGRDRRRSSPS